MAYANEEVEQSNWRSSNVGIMIIAFLVIMPFGLVLLAMLTLGKNVNFVSMFKNFWKRMTNGADFKQPDLWASASDNWKQQHADSGNAAFNEYKAGRETEAREAEATAQAQMQAEEEAFNEFQAYKKAAEDKAMFERFKADSQKT